LSIVDGADGRILLHCFKAGSGYAQIAEATGFTRGGVANALHRIRQCNRWKSIGEVTAGIVQHVSRGR
jgi:hypothetical protein